MSFHLRSEDPGNGIWPHAPTLLSSLENKPTAPGRASSRLQRSWFNTCTRLSTRSSTGPTRRPQRTGAVMILAQHAPPVPVGPQGAREHIGVEPVICGPSPTATQRHDLATCHHEHSKRGIEKYLDHRAITASIATCSTPAAPNRRAISFSPIPSWGNVNWAITRRRRRPRTPHTSAMPRPPLPLVHCSARPAPRSRRSLTRCRRCCWSLTARRSKRGALSPVPNAGPAGLAALLLALEGQASQR